ncbi:chaperone modulatory protein CbpM [Methylomarinovum caldicuralii]|uniref:Chaperone modulatory protein CbpM n=1 Tax=Methylomarinovum caldicuralii TaxID=438856 RepID=A0AAU9CQ47_9GAMM|nr:chaperone modulator CbpM [Methylomarinovum caldicuralii]BCX81627.1 chaperone modulatory protein CbpM [Methylomarinovum caldicuralii]
MLQEKVFTGVILDENFRITLVEVCRIFEVSAERVIELVDQGVLEPQGGPEPTQWWFDAVAFERLRTALRLAQDLGVNPPGAALVLDLLEELRRTRR